jgi:tRNA modification GTPase
MNDTIAAVSTPLGEGALAVIRVSGPMARPVVAKLFRGPKTKLEPRKVYFGSIHDSAGKLDDVLVTWFAAPASYTGEDVAEISCHGGILVTRRILDLFLANGVRPAEPGEFTQRAFLNGKMDLTQAEAVMDLIRAQTDLALRAANEQLAGELGRELDELREQLLTVLAHVEAYIDFPDEHIDPDTGNALIARVAGICSGLSGLLATADRGRILRHGLRTVIFGEPNVGKSSLLNLLLGYERAIVSEIPGTTRDTIEEVINIRGIPVRLIDTAGARPSRDRLESEGIRRTYRAIDEADLILRVVDASGSRSSGEVAEPSKAQTILIMNKVDLGVHPDWSACEGVRISCLHRLGLESLNEAIWHRVMGKAGELQNVRVAINARHQRCLQQALDMLEAGRQSLREERSPELVAIELRSGMEFLGQVVGRMDTDELLGKIFSEFCIGK